MELKMKTLIKFAAVSILTMSAIAPALAAEENTLLDRNVYTNPVNAQQQVRHNGVQVHRAIDAFARASGSVSYDTRDFGVGSQS
jgi:hypothetical protein